MKRRIWTIAVGLAAVAALIVIPAAMAAYTSPRLEVTQAGASTVVKASLNPNDDPTASVRITAPVGTQLTTNQAPGTVLGPVKAIVKALDLAGADLPLEGQLIVAAPGQITAPQQAQCLGAATPLATWVMVLTAAGQTLQVPTYLVATPAAQAGVGPSYIHICLPPPDVPAGAPGRATFGAKVYSAELAINGVFSAVPTGTWIGFWTPYTPLVGAVNFAATVASPAAVAPGAITLSAKRSKLGATLSGAVTQGGQARPGAVVTIAGGSVKAKVKTLGKAKVAANGKFAFKAKVGTFFRATAVAAPGPAPSVCDTVGRVVAPLPCVNPTVSGFTAKTKIVKKS